MWNLKNKINEQTRRRLNDTKTILTAARWKRSLGEWLEKGKGLRSIIQIGSYSAAQGVQVMIL